MRCTASEKAGINIIASDADRQHAQRDSPGGIRVGEGELTGRDISDTAKRTDVLFLLRRPLRRACIRRCTTRPTDAQSPHLVLKTAAARRARRNARARFSSNRPSILSTARFSTGTRPPGDQRTHGTQPFDFLFLARRTEQQRALRGDDFERVRAGALGLVWRRGHLVRGRAHGRRDEGRVRAVRGKVVFDRVEDFREGELAVRLRVLITILNSLRIGAGL